MEGRKKEIQKEGRKKNATKHVRINLACDLAM